MITCILIFLSISFAGFSSIGASDENEENFDCKNYNTPAEFTNSTCCDYFEFYSDEIHDIAHNKTSSYAKDNIEELSKSKNTHGLQYCIYEKYLTETAGFVAEGKYDLDKFDSFVREHAELSTYADDISSFARKCASLAAEVDVVEKQEKMTGIKAEHCNFEPKFMSNCMDVHLDAVRREIQK